MINNKKCLAVILARGGSKGIPKKNIYEINGHPLISYSLEAAKNTDKIDKIVVSSDSNEILKVSKKYGVDKVIKRPKYLSNDRATSADALYHAVIESEKKFNCKFDYIVELPCVSPLRDHNDINAALKILASDKYDSVVSYVDTGEKHPIRLKRIKNKKVTNFCKEFKEAKWGSIRQDFEPCYIRNGAIYSMTRSCIIRYKSRWGQKSFPYIMSAEKSINIDESFDLLIAKMMIENGYCKNFPKIKSKISKNISSTKKLTLLVTTPIHILKNFKQKLLNRYNCIFISASNLAEIKKILPVVDYWICNPSPIYKIDSKVLQKADKLKAILTPSTGVTHLDNVYLERKKINVISIKKHPMLKNIKASSEFTFGLVFDGLRNLSLGTQSSKNGYWRQQEDHLRGSQLYEKKLGIVGYGRIGSNVAKYAKSFGMKCLANDPHKKKYLVSKGMYANLDRLIKTSDVILISVHLNASTKNLVNKTFLRKMNKNAILVNTSRGEVVDEKALLNVLKNKLIKSAYLDVITNEQQSDLSSHPLIEYSKKNNNLTITPHMAGLTFESENIAAEIVINLLENVKKKN